MSAGAGYSRFWFGGRDGALFQSALVEDGVDITPNYFQTRNDPNVHRISTRVARPLPAGTYQAKEFAQGPKMIPCDSTPDSERDYWTRIFTFEAPVGTLHEAFFDPAAIGGGAGADKDNGVLKPTAFSLADGTGVSLQSVSWQTSAVEMRLEPHAPARGLSRGLHRAGRRSILRLDFDDASETGEGESRAPVVAPLRPAVAARRPANAPHKRKPAQPNRRSAGYGLRFADGYGCGWYGYAGSGYCYARARCGDAGDRHADADSRDSDARRANGYADAHGGSSDVDARARYADANSRDCDARRAHSHRYAHADARRVSRAC